MSNAHIVLLLFFLKTYSYCKNKHNLQCQVSEVSVNNNKILRKTLTLVAISPIKILPSQGPIYQRIPIYTYIIFILYK